MEKIKTRKEMDPKDCWDLTKVIKDDSEFQQLKEIVLECNKKIVAMKGHILDNGNTLFEYLTLEEKESRAYERLLIFSKLRYDEDTNNQESKARLLEIDSLANEITEQESFILSEMMEKDLDYVLDLLKKKEELKEYQLYFERMYKDKKRVLSEAEEKIIALASNVFGTPDDAFTALDVTDASFEAVQNGEDKIELTHYNYGVLLEHENQDVRKQAFENYHDFYRKHKNTFASLLKGNYQELEFARLIRKYNSALEMSLDGIDVDKKVYDNLIASVHQYMDYNIEYQKLKAKVLGTREYHLYDTYVPVVKLDAKKYTKEEAIGLVTKALKPLGDNYLQKFQSVFDSQSVDFYPNAFKENGAYQWGCFDSPSYVLLNFNGTIDFVSTLAHELGHAVHTLYSNEANSYTYANYEIFLAEIASTVNETLLSFYHLEHAKTKKEKAYYLCEFLDKVKATIYRQTMFAEFEKIMSEKCQNKESLTEELMTNTYYDLNKEYFRDSVILDDSIRYECMRISHFYRPFYVYKYATGLISALCIVSDILSGKEGFVEKYLTFLKSGSSKNVLGILNIVDIDLTDMSAYEKAFGLIEQQLNELKEMIEDGGLDE